MNLKITVLLIIICSISFAQQEKENGLNYNVFSFEKQVTLPGLPEEIYDAATGDISGWWDHSFSENPKVFYIEARPGGGFREIFDDEENGVLHATVIYADRGKLLRFDGPLGLSGYAIQVVTTYNFEPAGSDSTLFTVSVRAAGEMNSEIPGIVESVWEHFIFERFKPYVETGKHKDKQKSESD